MKLELGSVRAYLFELELGSRVKPKARARFDSARVFLRTISNELKARLDLTLILLKQAKARLANVARAQFDSARVFLRTTSNELKARLDLTLISLKRAKARLANVIIIISII
ncbi:hypothetical protein Hdeb2414_s0011g00360091 [Helianthus debilis subsp. tardiflorus]